MNVHSREVGDVVALEAGVIVRAAQRPQGAAHSGGGTGGEVGVTSLDHGVVIVPVLSVKH